MTKGGGVPRALLLSGLWIATTAHVGSPDAWFEGKAGPYQVLALVRMPTVVPGVATVRVHVVDGPVDRVTALITRYDASTALPPPDVAKKVDGETDTYQTTLWVMAGGSNGVTIFVQGSRGSGSVLVPVMAVASGRLPLGPGLGALLVTLGVVLFAGAVTIIGTAVRESVLPPGETPDGKRRMRALLAMGGSAALFLAILGAGRFWWSSVDAAQRDRQYRPLASTTGISGAPGAPELRFAITDSTWLMRGDQMWLRRHNANAWSGLIPDHGKLMHLFLVRSDDAGGFAHLHPATTDSVAFTTALPPLASGEYRVYGDIVHESGFTETLVSTIRVGAARTSPWTPADSDDAWRGAPPSSTDPDPLGGGLEMRWLRDSTPLIAGRPASLRFSLVKPDGSAAAIEPYMGLPGHAVIARDDGSVFVHLHPSGTISMASQQVFLLRAQGDTAPGAVAKAIAAAAPMAMPSGALPSVVSFPYAFPKAGTYHVWVQLRTPNGIQTGAFEVRVQPQ